MEKTKNSKYANYHKGTPARIRRDGGIICTNPACTVGVSYYCKRCGFNAEEAELRKRIPLEEYEFEIKDKDGNVIGNEIRRRKNLGGLRRIEAMVDGHE